MCGYVLDLAPSSVLPDAGGHRPHVNVLIRLEDLENRARAGCHRAWRGTTPRLVALAGDTRARRIGCALGALLLSAIWLSAAFNTERTIGTAEAHHLIPWEHGGETKLSNLAMLCRVHHRQVHSTEWVVRIRDGLPEFIPPRWIDPDQRPRRRALPHLAAAN